MHRPRHRRRDPQRTGPIRNTGGAWREGAYDPWEPEGDPASSSVREGYRVIDEQIRRGRRTAEDLDPEPWTGPRHHRERRRPHPPSDRRYDNDFEEARSRYGDEPWHRRGDGFHLLSLPMRHLERLVREIFHQIASARPDPWRLAGLLFQLQVEAVSELARVGLGGWADTFREDVRRIEDDIDEGFDEEYDEGFAAGERYEREEERRDWPVAPSVPTVIRASVPIPVYVFSHERTEIDLELDPGSQSLDLEVEAPLVAGPGQRPHPAFEAAFVALDRGPRILRVEVPRELPAGVYPRRVVIRATGEPVGELIVQVGTIPTAPEPNPKPRPKPRPRARKP